MTTRICINIDLDTDNIELAYRELYEKISATGLEWESSDEWFYDDGDDIPEFVISEARMRFQDGLPAIQLAPALSVRIAPAMQHDYEEALTWVWSALHAFREDCIPESDPMYDDQWDDICTGMAWIREGLGLVDLIEKENDQKDENHE